MIRSTEELRNKESSDQTDLDNICKLQGCVHVLKRAVKTRLRSNTKQARDVRQWQLRCGYAGDLTRLSPLTLLQVIHRNNCPVCAPC